MPDIKLRIDDLILDHDNPRITHAEGQQEALQKIVKDQKRKLVKLAQSIAENGLSPMDRLLVLRVNRKPVKFIALEGNRRVAALKLLKNPTAMSGLDIPSAMKSALEGAAKVFSSGSVEPISCFELGSRQEGDYWLELRHKGEQDGVGVVGWSMVAQHRFGTRSPALQALDMVTEQGALTAEERTAITDKFPLSTLQRFVESRDARKEIGFDVKNGKLVTSLPASEIIKPLKKIVLDLATKRRRVNTLMKTPQMLDYIRSFDKANKADMSKATDTVRTFDEIPSSEFTRPKSGAKRRKVDPTQRKGVVPKNCSLQVTDNRIAEIYKELCSLQIESARNAIAVLMRVFFELSVDHFIEDNGSSLVIKQPNGKETFKPLAAKISEAVDTLVKIGAPRSNFAAVIRSQSDKSSPLHVDVLHAYVHDRFSTPSPQQLTAAWDHAQPLFEKIWP